MHRGSQPFSAPARKHEKRKIERKYFFPQDNTLSILFQFVEMVEMRLS